MNFALQSFVNDIDMKRHAPLEDLAYMRSLVEESRRALSTFGAGYTIWGSVIGLASWLHCATLFIPRLNNVSFLSPTIIWPAAMAIGTVAHLLVFRARLRQARSRSYAGRIVGHVWLAAWIGILAVQIGAALNAHMPAPAGIAILIGGAIYTNGYVAELRMLQWTAAIWWAAGAIMFATPVPQAMLISAILYPLFLALPGLILMRQEAT